MHAITYPHIPQNPDMNPLRKKDVNGSYMKPKIPLFEVSRVAPSKYMDRQINARSRINI